MLAVVFTSVFSFAQDKKILDHTVYNSWNRIGQTNITNDGQYIIYDIVPGKGDNKLVLANKKGEVKDTLPRAKGAQFSPTNEFMVYKIVPEFEKVRALKLKKTPKKKMPKDSLGIYFFRTDSITKISNIKSYKVAEEGAFIAYMLNKNELPKPETKKHKCKIFKKKKKQEEPVKYASNGKQLTVLNPLNGKKKIYNNVTEYVFSEDGNYLSFITHLKTDTLDSSFVFKLQLEDFKLLKLYSQGLNNKKLAISKKGNHIAFLNTTDTSKNKIYSLVYSSGNLTKRIADTLTSAFEEGYCPSIFKTPYFSEDESKLYFGIAQKPINEPKDTMLESEKYKLDIWHWEDKRLQPQQLKALNKDKNRTYLCVYHTKAKNIVQLQTKELNYISTLDEGNGNKGLGISSDKYQKTYSWAMPWPRDYYVVDFRTGKKNLVLEKFGFDASLSPNGKYLVYYNGNDSLWMSKNLETNQVIVLNKDFKDNFSSDVNGMPFVADPVGISAWTEEGVIIESEHDVWHFDLSGKGKHRNLTLGYGREKNLKFRFQELVNDETYVYLSDDLHFKSVDYKTKAEAIWRLQKYDNSLNRIYGGDFNIYKFAKAEDSNDILIRKQSFTDYPNLYVSDYEFDNVKQVSDANPQQKDYNWGTVEQVYWDATDGRKLEGLLYKPEKFDSTKKYPMLVYFYEKYDDRLHAHYIPKPTASIIYATEYVSSGYIVFIPNIEYTPGHPGKDAMNCIVSGTEYLVNKHNFIDSTKLGLQGQSWGGYQTAFLVTQTDMYCAAMAGAPVSNMTSAYGGIRWGSGMSRMFQYERTQSRIGQTLWDAPELYLENSPVFFAPKVKTPLLIMHNDGDGAVPWYQGIEMFVALRRLNKEAWLLNYNGDQHNLMKTPNRVDLSIRMKQFFDYYMLGKPAPKWLIEGRPAVVKGKEDRYDLIED